jgi:hypothetical protein
MSFENLGVPSNLTEAISTFRNLLAEEKNFKALEMINDRAINIKDRIHDDFAAEPHYLQSKTIENILMCIPEWHALIGSQPIGGVFPTTEHKDIQQQMQTYIASEVKKVMGEIEATK